MKTDFKKTLLASLVVPFALGASSASAVEITNWAYSTTNTFGGAAFSAGGNPAGLPVIETQKLSWGNSDLNETEDRSSVSITDVDVPVGDVVDVTSGLITNGDFVNGGQFTHDNNIINASYRALTSFNLITQLDLTAVLPVAMAGTTETVGPIGFGASFRETFNYSVTSDCPATSTGTTPCDDIFTLNNVPTGGGVNENGWYQLASNSFTIDDYTYTVFLELEDLEALLNPTCAVAGAPSNCIGLLTEENQSNTFQTRFRIASTQVPEPGTLALLGMGLAGLGLSRRRKAAKS